VLASAAEVTAKIAASKRVIESSLAANRILSTAIYPKVAMHANANQGGALSYPP
jgi:hypothetical protein